MNIILPGGTIGILGGGQLGRMLAMEGRRMGYRVGVLDPAENCPAAQVADFHIQSELTNTQRVMDFVAQVDVVTIETELVPWMLLANIETGKATRPSSCVLALVQDRLVQRQFLHDHNMPQTRFASVRDKASLTFAAQHVTFPAIVKKRRSGYDGKGQIRVANVDHLIEAWRELGEVPSVLEAIVPFKMELSVVLARGLQGDIQVYPLAENAHRRNILHTTRVPAQVADTVRLRAEELAVSLAEALDHCGVMAVELFLLEDDTLLVNEVAPRPHNSGHFTFGACVTSQFEQHLRAICGLPLGDSSLMRPVVMVNLLGDLWRNGPPRWDHLLAHPQVRLHLYGKTQAGPGRKMGHILLLTENPEQAFNQAECLLQGMMEGDSQEKGFPIEHPDKEPFQKRSNPLETPA
ncbi:MAG: 5-(carboxyamino)imidazole ribonucleotide synthase [Nitrospirota bacterium]|nr:5-(carboxyamino)imidazole ribonucleotide synthase [Nitrospirota bacterium]